MNKIVNTGRAVAIGTLVAMSAGCVSAPVSPDQVEAELLAADRAYEAYNLENGYEAASRKFVDLTRDS